MKTKIGVVNLALRGPTARRRSRARSIGLVLAAAFWAIPLSFATPIAIGADEPSRCVELESCVEFDPPAAEPGTVVTITPGEGRTEIDFVAECGEDGGLTVQLFGPPWVFAPLTGTAQQAEFIVPEAPPGTYEVSVDCDVLGQGIEIGNFEILGEFDPVPQVEVTEVSAFPAPGATGSVTFTLKNVGQVAFDVVEMEIISGGDQPSPAAFESCEDPIFLDVGESWPVVCQVTTAEHVTCDEGAGLRIVLESQAGEIADAHPGIPADFEGVPPCNDDQPKLNMSIVSTLPRPGTVGDATFVVANIGVIEFLLVDLIVFEQIGTPGPDLTAQIVAGTCDFPEVPIAPGEDEFFDCEVHSFSDACDQDMQLRVELEYGASESGFASPKPFADFEGVGFCGQSSGPTLPPTDAPNSSPEPRAPSVLWFLILTVVGTGLGVVALRNRARTRLLG